MCSEIEGFQHHVGCRGSEARKRFLISSDGCDACSQVSLFPENLHLRRRKNTKIWASWARMLGTYAHKGGHPSFGQNSKTRKRRPVQRSMDQLAVANFQQQILKRRRSIAAATSLAAESYRSRMGDLATHVRQRLESLISSGKSSAPPSDQLVPLPASKLLVEVFVPNVQVAKDRGFNGFCMCLPYRPYRASPLCI